MPNAQSLGSVSKTRGPRAPATTCGECRVMSAYRGRRSRWTAFED
jgi:hypothetical protein